MSDFLPIILSSSFTKSDILRRVHYIRSYCEAVHYKKSKTTIAEYLVQNNATKSDCDTIVSWNIIGHIAFEREKLYSTIESLMKDIDGLPTITLFVPYEPDNASLVKLGTWVRNNIGNTVIIDLRLEPSAVGGAHIAYRGKFADYSLGRILNREREHIREMIGSKMGSS